MPLPLNTFEMPDVMNVRANSSNEISSERKGFSPKNGKIITAAAKIMIARSECSAFTFILYFCLKVTKRL